MDAVVRSAADIATFNKQKVSLARCSGSWRAVPTLGAALFATWAYASIQPPAPRVCGLPNGPPVTAPRIRLRDGRYMAYKEAGVPKDKAKVKIVSIHPYGGSRHSIFPVSTSLLEELGVYMVAFDRPGYGQSDPFPGRTLQSQAYDIQELADQLELGPKFHIIAVSIGGFSAWACLNYIPERLAGVAMMAPVVNYWWPKVPPEVARAAFNQQCFGDRLSLRVAHYAPWLLYFWMTQKTFPTSSTVGGIEKYVNKMDLELMTSRSELGLPEYLDEALQQGIYESLHRDMKIMFGKWEFDPGDLPDNNIPVHIWQGNEDYLVPVLLQRYIHERLPWVHYHELPGVGHMIDRVPGLNDKVLMELLNDS